MCPSLLRLDVLHANVITPDTLLNRLVNNSTVQDNNGHINAIEKCSVPFKMTYVQFYADIYLPEYVLITRTDLCKLHSHFVDLSEDKLFKLLRKERPEDTTPETL